LAPADGVNGGVVTNLTQTFAGKKTIDINIVGGGGGSVPYQSALSTTALLANGTAGQVLQSNGTTLAPTWSSVPIALINIIYPIGAIIQSTVLTNPGTYITGTTWVAYGAGQVLVGKATIGTFQTAGSIGGAETNVIGVNNLPAHSHPNTLTDPGHIHSWGDTPFGLAVTNETNPAGGSGHYLRGFPPGITPVGSNITGITITNANNTTTATAFNILQPYIVVYTWTRTG
jgi:hypothetical protein